MRASVGYSFNGLPALLIQPLLTSPPVLEVQR